MSVLICNMEMPTSCADCRFAVDGWCYACPPKSEAERQRITTNYCPLVPVPPHGRLIDAEALDIYRREDQAWHDYEQNSDNEYLEGVKDGLHEVAKQLSIAPTIIPADRKDGAE